MTALIVLLLAAASTLPTATPLWVWPLDPHPVVRRFEPPASPWGPGHRGVDLAGTPGRRVLTAGPGIVTYAGLLAGRGVVVVGHGHGLRTTYEPVRATVRVGALLAAGDVIGHLDGRGSHCAPQGCLHWGLLRGPTYLDPLTLFRRAGPARLLPLGPPGDAARPRPTAPRFGSVPITAAVRALLAGLPLR